MKVANARGRRESASPASRRRGSDGGARMPPRRSWDEYRPSPVAPKTTLASRSRRRRHSGPLRSLRKEKRRLQRTIRQVERQIHVEDIKLDAVRENFHHNSRRLKTSMGRLRTALKTKLQTRKVECQEELRIALEDFPKVDKQYGELRLELYTLQCLDAEFQTKISCLQQIVKQLDLEHKLIQERQRVKELAQLKGGRPKLREFLRKHWMLKDRHNKALWQELEQLAAEDRPSRHRRRTRSRTSSPKPPKAPSPRRRLSNVIPPTNPPPQVDTSNLPVPPPQPVPLRVQQKRALQKEVKQLKARRHDRTKEKLHKADTVWLYEKRNRTKRSVLVDVDQWLKKVEAGEARTPIISFTSSASRTRNICNAAIEKMLNTLKPDEYIAPKAVERIVSLLADGTPCQDLLPAARFHLAGRTVEECRALLKKCPEAVADLLHMRSKLVNYEVRVSPGNTARCLTDTKHRIAVPVWSGTCGDFEIDRLTRSLQTHSARMQAADHLRSIMCRTLGSGRGQVLGTAAANYTEVAKSTLLRQIQHDQVRLDIEKKNLRKLKGHIEKEFELLSPRERETMTPKTPRGRLVWAEANELRRSRENALRIRKRLDVKKRLFKNRGILAALTEEVAYYSGIVLRQMTVMSTYTKKYLRRSKQIRLLQPGYNVIPGRAYTLDRFRVKRLSKSLLLMTVSALCDRMECPMPLVLLESLWGYCDTFEYDKVVRPVYVGDLVSIPKDHGSITGQVVDLFSNVAEVDTQEQKTCLVPLSELSIHTRPLEKVVGSVKDEFKAEREKTEWRMLMFQANLTLVESCVAYMAPLNSKQSEVMENLERLLNINIDVCSSLIKKI